MRALALTILAACGPGLDQAGRHVCYTDADCDDGDPCTRERCGSDALCATVGAVSQCVSGDRCCPSGCAISEDAECARCGDAVVTAPETCDTAIEAGSPGACPTGCDDRVACTGDRLTGAACAATCEHPLIASCAAGDGCCPASCSEASDADCGALWALQVGNAGVGLFDLVATPDGGFLLVGRVDVGTSFDLLVMRLDGTSAVLWQRALSTEYSAVARAALMTAAGDFVVAGAYADGPTSAYNDAWLVKLDGDGNVLWQRRYGGGAADVVEALVARSDGSLVLGGWTHSFSLATGGWLMATDDAGQILWEKKCDELSTLHALVVGPADSIVAVGSTDTRLWAVALGADGTTQWQRAYGGGLALGRAVVRRSGAGYWVAGELGADTWLVALDDSGAVTAQRTFAGPDGDAFRTIAVAPDRLLLGGTTASFSVQASWLVATNASADLLWQRAYSHPASRAVYDLAPLSGGRLAMLTSSTGYDGSGYLDPAAVLILDADGALAGLACPGGLAVPTTGTAATSAEPDEATQCALFTTTATAASTNVAAYDPQLPVTAICQ